MSKISTVITVSVIIVLGLFSAALFSGLRDVGQSSSATPSANYEPRAFSSYVSSSLSDPVMDETGSAVFSDGAYSGRITFRSDVFTTSNLGTCYQVLEEDQSLFPVPIEKVCATNDVNQLSEIHLVGGVTEKKGQRYLVTLRDPIIQKNVASGLIVQVRVRDRKEDEELTSSSRLEESMETEEGENIKE